MIPFKFCKLAQLPIKGKRKLNKKSSLQPNLGRAWHVAFNIVVEATIWFPLDT
jgi:hypothetical protein